jgi:DNA-binding response OmpR family regulator
MTHDSPAPHEPGEEYRPTVLIVEDDEDLRFALAALLVRAGYSVLTAAWGRDALAMLRRPFSAIDVVVLDVYLPDTHGITLCTRLRELYPDLPVIVVTGEASPLEASRLLELGVRRYFLKPAAPDEVLASVEAVLTEVEGRRTKSGDESEPVTRPRKRSETV